MYFDGADLTGANFSGVTINNANFHSTSLRDAIFTNATIGTSDGNVWFQGADLTGANFSEATINGTFFSSSPSFGTTILRDSIFTNAMFGTLDGYVQFQGADLTGADFSGATINDVSFSSDSWSRITILRDSIFTNATLGTPECGVNFGGADLTGVNFSGATINGADFSNTSPSSKTILRDAIFTNTTLGASGSGVNFGGADLTGANFSGATINSASFYRNTLSGATILKGAFFMNAAIGFVSFRFTDLTSVDFRGATGIVDISDAATIKNTLLADGKIEGFSMTSSEDSFTIKKHVPKEGAESVSAKIYADASISGGAVLTLAEDATLEILKTVTLALDTDSGSKISLRNGAQLILEDETNLELNTTLRYGTEVTIFEGGSVVGDVVSFLKTEDGLSAYATEDTVVYDTTDGLSVKVVKNTTDGVDSNGFSVSFVDWVLSDANTALANLPSGFIGASDFAKLPGGNDPLLNALLAGDAGTARAILDRLSPKSYAALVAMPVEAFNADARSISARLEQRRFDRFSGKARWEFFAQAQMNSVENDTATDAPTFDFDSYGVLAGADYRLDAETTLGVSLGASTGEAKVHNGGGKIESTDFRLTGFAGKSFEKCFVKAGAQLGYANYDVKRRTDYGNTIGDTMSWSTGVFADAGTMLAISETKKIYAMPYVGLAYMHTQADAFTESGSYKAFAADEISGDSLRARLGCGFSWGFALGGANWRVGLDMAYSHDFLGDEVDVDVMTQSGEKISETAKALPEDMFSVGPTLCVDVSPSASIYGGYTFNAGTDSFVNHSANFGFRTRF